LIRIQKKKKTRYLQEKSAKAYNTQNNSYNTEDKINQNTQKE